MGFWTAPESNPPDASGNPIFLISEFLLITGMKKKIIKEEKTPTLCVSYFIISHYLCHISQPLLFSICWPALSLSQRDGCCWQKRGLGCNCRGDKMEIETQEDFVLEHKQMAWNWQPDRARSSQNTMCTFIYTKAKQNVMYMTYW